MIRTVDTKIITENVKEMCIEANHYLSKDMDIAMKNAVTTEKSELGRKILNQLQDNLKIADEEMIPICQDTGMAVIFLEVGQDVHFEGEAIEDAINEGVRQGYTEGYLRKSVVKDPLIRENTKDNTPAVIHYSIVPGDKVKITIAPKGFGSENMSRVFMLKPADGIEGVKDAVLTAVKDAGPNACPPMVVGVGIGGTFEKCAILAQKGADTTGRGTFRYSLCQRHGRRTVRKNQPAWYWTGRTWRYDNSTCRQYQYLSDPYRGTSCGSQHLLSCKPSCGKGSLKEDSVKNKIFHTANENVVFIEKQRKNGGYHG